ncbi:hypothetical protein H5410_005540 [Solanum commersonii]|uniref:Uncharacterized protein n=1 Tax=Solanum commersonii TaxID=4109 RepID=A0A9J6A7M0_SOLCO|nr:hypothetical protein H5410_005540 [Solanum commersonii]
MDGGDVFVEKKVTCASWIKRRENAHLVATYLFEDGGEPVRIVVHPNMDDFGCSTTTGCN